MVLQYVPVYDPVEGAPERVTVEAADAERVRAHVPPTRGAGGGESGDKGLRNEVRTATQRRWRFHHSHDESLGFRV